MPTHGQYSRENLLEVRLQIKGVNLLHPWMIEMRRRRWRRATLFVDFANRNFECHIVVSSLLPSAARFCIDPIDRRAWRVA
jgi:hypothetical protein